MAMEASPAAASKAPILYRIVQPFIPSDEEVAAGFISVPEPGAQLAYLATSTLPGTFRVQYRDREGLVPTRCLQQVLPPAGPGTCNPGALSIDGHQSDVEAAAAAASIRRRHQISSPQPAVFVSGPRYCTLCGDYLWHCRASQCAACKRVFHLTCAAASANGDNNEQSEFDGFDALAGCDGSAPPSDDAHFLYLHQAPAPIEAWTSRMVLEWLCAANLSRFLDVCCKYLGQKGFPGGSCLRGITDQVLTDDWRLSDAPHRWAISEALKQLIDGVEGGSFGDWPALDSAAAWRLVPEGRGRHQLRLSSFAEHRTSCSACGLRLLGIYQQGLQCCRCGAILHRHCARFQPRQKRGEDDDCCRPAVPAVLPSIVFGLSIEEQVAAGERQLPDESDRRNLDNYAETYNVYDSLAAGTADSATDEPTSPEAASHLVPYIVRLCTYTVERESLTSVRSLLQFYRYRRTASDVEALRADFGNGVDAATRGKLDGKLAAQLLKLWLQELPTSLLPSHNFDRFVRVMDLPARQLPQQAIEFRRLLAEAPVHHRATLQHLMCHFVQLFRKVRAPDPQQFIAWSRVFGQLLLRPTWSRVTGLVAGDHARPCVVPLHDVAKGVLSHGRWGCVLPSFLRLSDPSQVDHISMSEQPWYWGDISKSEVQAVLANRPDGSFLVRNAANMSGGYTLTLKKDGENKLIRIYPRYKTNNRLTYGFSERATEFFTVAQVINYYTYKSLREYNENLDVLLLYPISKFAGGPEISSAAPQGNAEEARQELLTLYQEMGREISESMVKMDEHAATISTLKDQQLEAERGSKCYSQVVLTLSNNIVKMDGLIDRGTAVEDQMRTNRSLQENRLQMYRSRQEAAEKEAQRIRHDSQVLQAEVRTMRADVRAIQEKRIRLKAILMTLYGVSRETIDAEDGAIPGANFSSYRADSIEQLSLAEDLTAPPQASPWDPADWLDRQITKADPLLRRLDPAPIGTFLIHASRSGGQESLVLSVRSPCGVRFCKIFMELGQGQQQTGRCGFDSTNPTAFSSLESLVAYYRMNSLGKHNRDMDTCLFLPLKQLPPDRGTDIYI